MLQALLHWLGYGLCHQLPARSFFAAGYQLPVCARDTGIYFGVVASLGVIALVDRGRRSSGMPRPWVLTLAAALFAFMVWDGVTSYAGLRTTTNDLRLITGLCAGFPLGLVLAPLLNSQLWRKRSEGPVLGAAWQVAVWAAAIPLAFMFLRYAAPFLGAAYPLATAAAILMTFTAVNLVVVLLAPHFERRAEHLRDVWLAVLIALSGTLVEIAALAWLRVVLLSVVLSR
jgi:uncharacterized membrane protein